MIYTYYKTVDSDKLTKEIMLDIPNIPPFYINTFVGQEIHVVVNEELSDSDVGILDSTVSSHNPNPTLSDVITNSINAASFFGQTLFEQFAVENVAMGITQAGKTIPVTLYLHKLSHYIRDGSLYAAITECNTIIADTNRSDLAPFVTTERITLYKHKIQTYMGIAQD